MTRSRAALLHLWPSLLLLALGAALVLVFWYPSPFRHFAPGSHFSALLILSGALLGPALTWLVYRGSKSRLAMVTDLTVIGLVQLAAVAWGLYTLHIDRPYFLVFSVDRFEALSGRDVEFSQVNDPAFLDKPHRGLVQLYANMPEDPVEFQKLLHEVMFEGKPDLPFRPEFWSNYTDRKHLVLQVSQPLELLRQARPAAGADIDAMVQNNGGDIAKLQFIPGMIDDGSFTVVIDASTGAINGYLDTNPWLKE